MMSNAVKNIMVRAISKRMEAGEKFEDVIKNYPRLTTDEIEEIKKKLRRDNMNGFIKVLIDKYNAVIGAIVAVLTAVFGVYWYIFAAYMALNIVDWLTGWWNARKKKEESSRVGMRGIIKKLGYWAVILVAFIVSDVFVQLGNDILGMKLSFLMMIGWYTLTLLMINEARSILENLVELGYNVPGLLVKGLAVTQKLVEAKGNTADDTD